MDSVIAMKMQMMDLEIHYEEYGTGKPIIILHGFTLDNRSMIESLEPIFSTKKGWRRFYIDLPGHGQTPGADWIKNSDDMLSIIQTFIDTLIPEQHFLVIGLSYGGYLAQGLVHKQANWIDGAAFIVPRVVSHPEARALPKQTVLARNRELLARLDEADRIDFESIAVIQTEEIWQRYEKEICSAVKNADTEFLKRLDARIDELSFDIKVLPELFDKPTLFVVGRQDHVVGYQDAWDVLEYYPRASFAVLDWAGHALQMEQQNLFNALVIEWLDRVVEVDPATRWE